MSTTVREQIHTKIAEVLEASLSSIFPGIRIERNRDSEVQEFPSLIVLDGPQEPLEPESTGFIEYHVRPTIEGYVRMTEASELGTAINELYGQTLLALFADRKLGGLAIDLFEGPLDVNVGHRPNQGPVGAFSLELTAKFWTAEDDPYRLGPAE